MKELFICISCNLLVIIRHGNGVRVPNKVEDKTFGKEVDQIPSQKKTSISKSNRMPA
jgi:hypothetical protein